LKNPRPCSICSANPFKADPPYDSSRFHSILETQSLSLPVGNSPSLSNLPLSHFNLV
jgi:hypothetical protein